MCFVTQDHSSRGQAQDILNGYVTQVNEDRQHLKVAVEQYGDTLLNDWNTTSQSVRATILKKINPDLPKKWPARVHLEYANTTAAEHQQLHRQINLVPYLDLQSLSKDPSASIGLLDARIEKSPETWAPFDLQQLITAWAAGLFQVHFNKDAVKISGCEYGKLVPWDAAAIHRGDLVGFPRARLLLEAQALVMSFLRRIVSAVLESSKTKELSGNKKWRQFFHTGPRKSITRSHWSHFATDAFSSPPTFDIDDLLTRAKARLHATGDHLELLQTEPAYMHRYVGKLGRMPVIGQNKHSVIGSKMISDEILGDIETNHYWTYIHGELVHLHEMYRQHFHCISRGEPLPKEVDDALGATELLLVNAAHLRSKQLQAIISQRPGFRRWYSIHRSNTNSESFGYHLKCSGETKDIFLQDPLWWCLMQLQGDIRGSPTPSCLNFSTHISPLRTQRNALGSTRFFTTNCRIMPPSYTCCRQLGCIIPSVRYGT